MSSSVVGLRPRAEASPATVASSAESMPTEPSGAGGAGVGEGAGHRRA
jgi:hypothetical protein